MIIKVSKTFAKFINETSKMRGLGACAEVVEFSESAYRWNVSMHDGFTDYNPNTGKYKAIQITFPADFYACPIYLTTEQLTREFRRYNVQNINDLRCMIQDLIEV